MRKIVIGILLVLPLIAYSQKYQVDKAKLDVLLQAYFYTLPACDTTVSKLQTALDSLKLTLQEHYKYTEVIIQERDNKAMEAETWRLKEANRNVIHKQELKTSRNKGRKEGFLAGGGIGLILLILVL